MRGVSIGEYGLKIKNIEAATLYEYNIGVRDHYEYKDAMFVNSLFKDYLETIGLKTHGGESTRDLICLEFNFGTRSYSDEVEHLQDLAFKYIDDERKARVRWNWPLVDNILTKQKKLWGLMEHCSDNRYNYHPMTKEELRRKIYNDGISITYKDTGRAGIIKNVETIHYKMLFRSTGKAKKGSCMFIRDELYDEAINYLRMGIGLPDKKAPIVEISAYSPLISSGIVGKVKINPENILILKDVDRFFTTNVVSVETDPNTKHCELVKRDNYSLKNTLFDGQALIDSSIFPDWGNGYILLRQHFCKMAAFNTNIQQFFKDYFGKNYDKAILKDMWGNEHRAKDIELITTDNAIKWAKFNVSYEYWCDWVHKSDDMFGIVKTAHESKLGNNQRMSYQMVNSMDNDIMEKVCATSVEYINRLKQDDDCFKDYLRRNINFSNDYEVLLALCDHNPDFIRSEYYRERKSTIINSYISKFKCGKVLQNAENLTVVGSPYAMLLYSATGCEEEVDYDDTFKVEPDSIQCYSERFEDGEYLAFFRSPFNSKNNLSYLHNKRSKTIAKYFNLGKQVIAINMNGTDAQDRNNGFV